MAQKIKSYSTLNGMEICISKFKTKFDETYLVLISSIVFILAAISLIKISNFTLSLVCSIILLGGLFGLKFSRKYIFVIDKPRQLVFCKETIFSSFVVEKTREISVADGMVLKIQMTQKTKKFYAHGHDNYISFYPTSLIYLSQTNEDTLFSHEDCNEHIYEEFLFLANSLKNSFNFLVNEEAENKKYLYLMSKHPKYNGIYSKDITDVSLIIIFIIGYLMKLKL